MKIITGVSEQGLIDVLSDIAADGKVVLSVVRTDDTYTIAYDAPPAAAPQEPLVQDDEE